MLGGVIFLIPLVVLVVLLGKAIAMVRSVTPISPADLPVGPAVGSVMIDAAALLVILLACLFAGLLARVEFAKRAVDQLEKKLFDRVPAYSLLRARARSVVSPEEAASLVPVLVRFDDSWQLGFEVDRVDDAWRVVYVPSAPNTLSGSCHVVAADRVLPLDMPVTTASQIVQRAGMSSGALLKPALAEEPK